MKNYPGFNITSVTIRRQISGAMVGLLVGVIVVLSLYRRRPVSREKEVGGGFLLPPTRPEVSSCIWVNQLKLDQSSRTETTN